VHHEYGRLTLATAGLLFSADIIVALCSAVSSDAVLYLVSY